MPRRTGQVFPDFVSLLGEVDRLHVDLDDSHAGGAVLESALDGAHEGQNDAGEPGVVFRRGAPDVAEDDGTSIFEGPSDECVLEEHDVDVGTVPPSFWGEVVAGPEGRYDLERERER